MTSHLPLKYDILESVSVSLDLWPIRWLWHLGSQPAGGTQGCIGPPPWPRTLETATCREYGLQPNRFDYHVYGVLSMLALAQS